MDKRRKEIPNHVHQNRFLRIISMFTAFITYFICSNNLLAMCTGYGMATVSAFFMLSFYDEKDSIIKGLDRILADVNAGKLEITDEYEDVHSFVEANLTERIGDAGKKLHTGRSRNLCRQGSVPSHLLR